MSLWFISYFAISYSQDVWILIFTLGGARSLVLTLKEYGSCSTLGKYACWSLFLVVGLHSWGVWLMLPTLKGFGYWFPFLATDLHSPLLGGMAATPYFWGAWLLSVPTLREYGFCWSPFLGSMAPTPHSCWALLFNFIINTHSFVDFLHILYNSCSQTLNFYFYQNQKHKS